MRDYIIMTDSCCDLNAHMAQELELNVVPLTVHMNGKDYANMLDGSEISFEEFYKNIRNGILSTTSAANVGQFEDAMRAVLALDGEDYKKHSAVIARFALQYLKTRQVPDHYGKLIANASLIRTRSDDEDFYICSLDDTRQLVSGAEAFWQSVSTFLQRKYTDA